ncbi:[LSU ribosomal protein L3P]-glutamine N5-methyltransferase [Kushneria sinocarnis]|uniref:[LSU ribosomal protein L3P]-glutamine N5-methyltransferase n=1 Tax=Kushneria sinocarnis TaxID=595502 RepID=A0A420WUW4_9GAMM|nr:50S ribosomal protein L3 N(5)-glutamine methyltransferase [Kushneria sinocarnis]RKQ97223.1 [LSU ribosomal protein L3P]-glutamine N5-methyltransferase [Kushneria sinocarnis]
MSDSARSTPDILELPDATLTGELITLRDWLRWCQSTFLAHRLHFGHGTDSAWDEAVALVLGALGLPRDVDPVVLDARLLSVERQRIIELTRERINTRRPLPYLLGEAFFAGIPFDVDDSVLIPRSPLAELVETGFAQWFPERDPAHVLDLCAGSGCIGIAAALMMPSSEVLLGEVSPEALKVAKRNIARHEVGARVRAVHSDLFEGVSGQRFDLIVSNPPYVDRRDLAGMPAEFQHEPTLALEAGEDGLAIVRRILREARSCLTDDGVLIVEVGNSERHVIEAWPEVPFVWLEFERGGHGVFALTAADLQAFAEHFAAA